MSSIDPGHVGSRAERIFRRAVRRGLPEVWAFQGVTVTASERSAEIDYVLLDSVAAYLTVVEVSASRGATSGGEMLMLQSRHVVHRAAGLLLESLVADGIELPEEDARTVVCLPDAEELDERPKDVEVWLSDDLQDIASAYARVWAARRERTQPAHDPEARRARAHAIREWLISHSGAHVDAAWSEEVQRLLSENELSAEEIFARIGEHASAPESVWALRRFLFDSPRYLFRGGSWRLAEDWPEERDQGVASVEVGADLSDYRDLVQPRHPELRSLSLQGFKGFSQHTELELAPITLIFGENSVGKSSLIQSLLSLKRTVMEDPAPWPTFFSHNGESTPQAFTNVVHDHDRRRSVFLGLRYSFLGPNGSTTTTHQFDHHADRSWNFEFALEPSTRWVGARSTALQVGGFGSVKFLRVYDRAGPAASEFAPGGDASQDQAYVPQSESALLALLRRIHPPYGHDRPPDPLVSALDAGAHVLFEARGLVPGNVRAGISDGGRRYLSSDLWSSASARLRHELDVVMDSVLHLGPLRAPSQRVVLSSGERPTDVGPDGHLVTEFLHANPEVQAEVSGWLPRLGIDYSLRIAEFEDPTPAGDVGDALAVVLRDPTGLEVSPTEVGFGISQLLPIVAQCLASQGRTICIEQPEIHVHPRLQADLGDLLITSATEKGNRLLVETHSEHLILRLQRRIREGAISSSDVRIYYVEERADRAGSRVLELQLDDTGRFVDEWPNGFFEERLEELF